MVFKVKEWLAKLKDSVKGLGEDSGGTHLRCQYSGG